MFCQMQKLDDCSMNDEVIDVDDEIILTSLIYIGIGTLTFSSRQLTFRIRGNKNHVMVGAQWIQPPRG